MDELILHAAWDLVHAQGRMLSDYAESSGVRRGEIWRNLHVKGEALRDLLEAHAHA